MNRLFTLSILFAFFYIPMCSASEVSHPPTFQQMKAASNEEGCGDSAINEALKYTENDVKHLIEQNDYIYIIGAAYQYDKPKTISFLKEFLPLIKNSPAGLSLFTNPSINL